MYLTGTSQLAQACTFIARRDSTPMGSHVSVQNDTRFHATIKIGHRTGLAADEQDVPPGETMRSRKYTLSLATAVWVTIRSPSGESFETDFLTYSGSTANSTRTYKLQEECQGAHRTPYPVPYPRTQNHTHLVLLPQAACPAPPLSGQPNTRLTCCAKASTPSRANRV